MRGARIKVDVDGHTTSARGRAIGRRQQMTRRGCCRARRRWRHSRAALRRLHRRRPQSSRSTAAFQVGGRGHVGRRDGRRRSWSSDSESYSRLTSSCASTARSAARSAPSGCRSRSRAPGRPVFVPEGYSTNENSSGGRLIVLAVDQPNIRFGGTPSDHHRGERVHRSPRAERSHCGRSASAPARRRRAFTADRAAGEGGAVAHERSEAGGVADEPANRARRSAGHRSRRPIDAAGGRGSRMRSLPRRRLRREHRAVPVRDRSGSAGARPHSDSRRRSDAARAARSARRTESGRRTEDAGADLRGLRPGRCELHGGSGDARVGGAHGVYTLQLDQPLFDAVDGAKPTSVFADRDARKQGLETLVGSARGTVVSVSGSGASFFERLEAELSGYYLVAVESDPRDRDGKPHPIRVDVARRGATVRARRQFVSTAEEAGPHPPRDAVTAGLEHAAADRRRCRCASSFALRGPSAGKIQLLIHADVGTEVHGGRPVSIGYMPPRSRGARRGQPVGRRAHRAGHERRAVAAAVHWLERACAPGDYTSKLAVAGRRQGRQRRASDARGAQRGRQGRRSAS